MRIIDFDFVHSRAIVRELARDTTLAAETRVGTTRKSQNANRSAPQIGGAVTIDRSRYGALKKLAVELQMGRPNRDVQCHR